MSLGTTRFVLAMMVLLNHLWLPTANLIGAHAVIAFYMISGYLMTKIVNEVYTGRWGRGRYLLNRFLRIYPLYWVVFAITLLGLVVLPQYFGSLYSLIHLPVSGEEWLANLTLYRLTDSPSILVPPAWSLFVESVFYVVIAAIGRWRLVVVGWFFISLAYTVYMQATGFPFAERYYPVTAASMFFSTGAVLYFCGQRLWPLSWISRKYLLGGFIAFALFPLMVEFFGGDRLSLGFYGAAILFVMVFATMLGAGNLNGGKIDKLLGDMAYPIFLTHFLSAGIVNTVTNNRYQVTGTANFLISTVFCVSLSLLIVLWLEPKLEKLRDYIRSTRVGVFAEARP